jgi:hypothetical protein
MKKLSIIILAIALLTSCGTTTTSNGTSAPLDWFSCNEQTFEAQTAVANKVNATLYLKEHVQISAHWEKKESVNGMRVFAGTSLIFFKNDSIIPGYVSTMVSANLKPNYLISKNPNKYSDPNCAKTVSIVKNSNGSYTVTGQYYMYEGYDSTKRHTIKLNFTTK